jgi:hypothetical protein
LYYREIVNWPESCILNETSKNKSKRTTVREFIRKAGVEMRQTAFRLAVLLPIIAIASHASATVKYDVRSTSVVNCDSAPHGLWTNSDMSGGDCANYFNIYGLLEIDNLASDSSYWTATLTGAAANPASDGDVAVLDLYLSGFVESNDPYKEEDGAAYTPTDDGLLADPVNNDIDFFTNISESIVINGDSYDITHYVGDYAFQFGRGANAKSPTEFGGSAWIQSADMTSDHWDLNLTFLPPSIPTVVPAPGAIAVFVLGLFGLGFGRIRSSV